MSKIFNPVVPYNDAIPGGMVGGKSLRLVGYMKQLATNFTVNLLVGPGLTINDTYAFHLDVREIKQTVVRNSQFGGKWGDEEVTSGHPIWAQKTFEMIITCNADAFRVEIDGKHFCDYAHRIPFADITHLYISRDVVIYMIEFFDDATDELEEKSEIDVSDYLFKLPPTQTTPFVKMVPTILIPGSTIVVEGKMPEDADRFSIDLQTGPSILSIDDIVFHFDLRESQKCVIRNNYQDMHWNHDERDGEMPALAGTNFMIAIICEARGFKVKINGIDFCLFQHRADYRNVRYVAIRKDVIVTKISFKKISNKEFPLSTKKTIEKKTQDEELPILVKLSPLNPWDVIRINGKLIEDQKLVVNLLLSSDPIDIAVKIDIPEFKNTAFESNEWWNIEDQEKYKPIQDDRTFQIMILCRACTFEVFINGRFLKSYIHYKPFHDITHMNITGDADIYKISIPGRAMIDPR